MVASISVRKLMYLSIEFVEICFAIVDTEIPNEL